MRIFLEILIYVVHYDYFFKMFLHYDTRYNQKFPHGILIEFSIYIYIYISTYVG
jgi:uncharacterized membrane protein YesL